MITAGGSEIALPKLPAPDADAMYRIPTVEGKCGMCCYFVGGATEER